MQSHEELNLSTACVSQSRSVSQVKDVYSFLLHGKISIFIVSDIYYCRLSFINTKVILMFTVGTVSNTPCIISLISHKHNTQ